MDSDAVIAPEINVEIRLESVDSEDVRGIARIRWTEAATRDRIKVVLRLGREDSMSFSAAELNDPGRRVGRACECNGSESGSVDDRGREVPLFALRRFRSEILNRGTALKRRSRRCAH